MVQGKFLPGDADLSEVFEIRRKVFIDEIGISDKATFDNLEERAAHVIIYEEYDKKHAVATGRLIINNNDAKIDNIAVLKEYRGKYYGDFVVRMLIERAITLNVNNIYLHAINHSKSFFEKIGFTLIKEEYTMDDEPYFIMNYDMDKCHKCCQKII